MGGACLPSARSSRHVCISPPCLEKQEESNWAAGMRNGGVEFRFDYLYHLLYDADKMT